MTESQQGQFDKSAKGTYNVQTFGAR
jgi:hypothetical protein